MTESHRRTARDQHFGLGLRLRPTTHQESYGWALAVSELNVADGSFKPKSQHKAGPPSKPTYLQCWLGSYDVRTTKVTETYNCTANYTIGMPQ